MASGIANGLQETLQQATTNLSRWLADDYKLTPTEVAIVLGSAIQYQIAEVVDPLVHVWSPRSTRKHSPSCSSQASLHFLLLLGGHQALDGGQTRF